MNIEIEIVRHFDGRVGHVLWYLPEEALVRFHNGTEIVKEWWPNDDFVIVHTITMEHEYEV